MKALKLEKKMLLIESITEFQYEFLKVWYSCRSEPHKNRPTSVFMVRKSDNKILFEQDWKNGYLWYGHLEVYHFFWRKFGYNALEINQMIKDVLSIDCKLKALAPRIGGRGTCNDVVD